MPLRQFLGALVYDGLRFERAVRGRWPSMHNRRETITVDDRGGVRCEWQWGSDVREWPIRFAEAPAPLGSPEVSFVIGHRGRSRLPQLLTTLRTVAAQAGVAVECVVVEQCHQREIEGELPPWVRYLHQGVSAGAAYGRAAAFNAGAAAASAQILVLHDNDMLVPERYALEVVAGVQRGWEALDLKRFIFYLDERDSAGLMAGSGLTLREHPGVITQNVHGGSIAITRAAYEAVGGFDEEFVGWGGEDNELWERIETRRATRFGYLPMIHLWHPPQAEKQQGRAAPGVARYWSMAGVPAEKRIADLLARRAQDGR
jgi:hypothetical protein